MRPRFEIPHIQSAAGQGIGGNRQFLVRFQLLELSRQICGRIRRTVFLSLHKVADKSQPYCARVRIGRELSMIRSSLCRFDDRTTI
jgi:hypothetical protein